MSVFLSPVGGAGAQFFDNSGNVLTGGKLYTYAAGTTTPQATYTSSAGSTFHANPIVLDAAGRVPSGGEIWLADNQIYKFVLKDSNDVLLATWDQLTGVNSNFVNYTAETELQTATSGQTVFTLTTMSYAPATGSLTVYVDGVNQYEGESYFETDSTTVTFVSGLHVGAEVKFTTAVQTTGNAVDASVVTYNPPFTGAVATNVEAKLAQTVSVKDFGAVGDGVTDDTAAIQAAVQSLTGNQTLFFPDGTYLISYIWTPYSDSDPTVMSGRGRGVCFIDNIPNIRLYGPSATIKCVNHDIATDGGFTFVWATKSNGLIVEGFNFDMTFTGYNTSASYYPLCGGVLAYDKYAGAGTQTTLCSRFEARNLTFKLYHPNGAFAITTAPYGSDNNNGFKIISVFASGDSAATSYSEQNRGLLVENIRFLKGHNGYGCWGVAYNEATFKDIFADAWVAASYTIATATYTGVNYVAPVRFYQYYCNGLTVDNVQMLSLPWAERTGAFQGRAGGVSVDSGLTDRFSGGGTITNCTFINDNDDDSIGSVFDCGMRSSLSGDVRISNNSFKMWGMKAAVGIFALGEEGTGKAYYTISNNIVEPNYSGPFIELVNVNNTNDASRIIKSLVVTNNVVNGWGGEGAVYSYRTGSTYYGVKNCIIANNVFDGSDSANSTIGTAIDVRGTAATDYINITNNIINSAATPVQVGSSTKIITDNVYLNNVGNGTFANYLTNFTEQLTTVAAGNPVSITLTAGYYAEYEYTEYTGAGAFVKKLVGLANSGTGIFATVGAGNTGYLVYTIVANIK